MIVGVLRPVTLGRFGLLSLARRVRPSVNAHDGWWHDAQARVPSTDNAGSKKSSRPNATSCAVGFVAFIGANALTLNAPLSNNVAAVRDQALRSVGSEIASRDRNCSRERLAGFAYSTMNSRRSSRSNSG